MRLGLTHVVLINHPELVEELLVIRNQDFRKNLGTRRLSSALGNGLLVSEGDVWLRQRRLMQPAFHRHRIEAMGATMVSIASSAVDRWRTGEKRDIYQEMTEVTLQIAARTLFGADISQDLMRIRRSALTMTTHIHSRLFSLMLLVPDNVPTPGNLRYAAAVRELDTLIYRLIAQRRAAAADGADDLLGTLLAARDDAGNAMSDRQVRDDVLTIMSASYDTTALALTWAWVLLAQNPAAGARLLADINAVLGNRAPTAADVSVRRGHVLEAQRRESSLERAGDPGVPGDADRHRVGHDFRAVWSMVSRVSGPNLQPPLPGARETHNLLLV
jgi:cytochrome P450